MSALMIAAVSFPATSAAGGRQSLPPAIERLTSQAGGRGSAELVVDARDNRFCALSLSQGRHVFRALVRVSQPHVRWRWRVARDASPGRWKVAIACAGSRRAVSSAGAGRAVGGLSVVAGSGRGRLVAPRSLRVTFSPATPTGRAPSSSFDGEAGLAATSNPFDFGQCTYHAYETRADVYEVAVARGVSRGRTPSGGWWWDAWRWLANARTVGIPTGRVARAGALVVFPRGYGGSSIGHVAYVVRVNRNRSYVISERNWNHDHHITTRLIVPGYAGIGFIYGGRGN